jgi:hypothetical protein
VKAGRTDIGVEVASAACRSMAAWASSRKPAPPSICATPASPIYEGTNGIQANDLIGRKLGRRHVPLLDSATDWILEHQKGDPRDAAAGAVPFMRLWGTVAGGWLLAQGALAAKAEIDTGEGTTKFLKAKIVTARFYGEHILPRASSLKVAATAGGDDHGNGRRGVLSRAR